MFTPPAEVRAVLAAFAPLFTHPTWARAQALLCGVLLAPANHTLTAALRALGLAREPGFQNCHRLLNRARWSARQVAQVLLGLLVEAFVPSGPVIVGLDDTIERRRGRKLTARAIYYDAARSSKACFQKTSGLRWMSVAVLTPVNWAARVWALPFLTTLCPSERYGPYVQRGRRHKPLAERARGLLGQVRRWLPERALIVVADSSYAALDFLAWCTRQARPITVICVSPDLADTPTQATMKATMKKAAYHKPYDEDFRQQAVELVLSSGKSCEQVARELGCSGYSLHLWKKRHLAQAAPIQVEGRTMSAEGMERENRALRKQVQYLERQREILKKAISILGEEPNPGMR